MRQSSTILAALAAFLLAVEAWGAGALAIDERQGDQWGWAVNYPDQAQADARALRECGQGCSIVRRFSNTCAAFAADQASGSTAYGYGHAASVGDAQANALGFCRQYGGAGSNCVLRAWGCDRAEEKAPIAEPETEPAHTPRTSAVEADQQQWLEQVGEAGASVLLPEKACHDARHATEGYALFDKFVVRNDSGCTCVREQQPNRSTNVPGWTCRVRVRYESWRPSADRGYEVRVGTGAGDSREGACATASRFSDMAERALQSESGTGWRRARDSGCFCPVAGVEVPQHLGGGRRWYCERVVQYRQ